MGRVVAEDDIKTPVFVFELGDGSIFRVAGPVDFVQRHALKCADNDAHRHAVGENGDGLVGMRLGDLRESLAHPLTHLGKALAAVDVPFLRIVAEIGELLGIGALKLGPGRILPIADVDLAQGTDSAQR